MDTTTNFFTALSALCNTADLNVAIQCASDGVTVTVQPLARNISDRAIKRPRALSFCGRPSQLDEQFFTALQKPMQTTDALFNNIADYEKSLQAARQQSAMVQAESQKLFKEASRQKEKLESLMKKIDDLASQKKYGEAIGVLQKATDLTDHKEAIIQRIDELRSMHGQLQLL
ncbi:PRTRC genetic system protein E [Chitinophaga terrae (ex Kim and Jung 2007)]|uniref:PRTRC system protein E n=1 Tax=Chitinophaga terrae (ex Kim and Jung 2007) TaxID=408074 RepID=UPI00278B85B5|nr:PRTRC system protein E [Chitinophaga terrae (ex Kim and Jung 2007)]MDQ0107483.1 PRTRC genetic system protein E [Chitinophaga terrae (ex Kim and Jung 2007)]